MKSFKQYLLEVGEQLTFDFDKPKETIHTQPPTEPTPVYRGTAYSAEALDDMRFDIDDIYRRKPTPKPISNPTPKPKTIKK